MDSSTSSRPIAHLLPTKRTSTPMSMTSLTSTKKVGRKRPRVEDSRGHTSANRSDSLSALSDTEVSDLISLYECPVCFDYIQPPIIQCVNGHPFCQTCRQQLPNVDPMCPKCREPLAAKDSRNLAMERLAIALQFPCKYSTDGCSVRTALTDLSKHADKCTFRPYSCPHFNGQCQWTGTREQVFEHLLVTHETDFDETNRFIPRETFEHRIGYWTKIFEFMGQHFYLILAKRNGKYNALVQIIGGHVLAHQFKYAIEMKTTGGLRLQCEDIPQSIRKPLSSLAFRSYGLQFNADTARRYVNDNEFDFNITFKKV